MDTTISERAPTQTDNPLSAREAVDDLFDCYADDVYRFALYTVGNPSDAKDIVQEVFIRAYQGWADFRQTANEKTWLFHIARNYISDFFRRKRTRGRTLESYRALPQSEPDNGLALEWKDAISRLRLEDRQVIVLRILQDMSVRDTAQTLGWSDAKVRTTQHRALRRLRQIWDDNNASTQTTRGRGR